MGGADSEIGRRRRDDRARERVLQAGVGPPHEQAAGLKTEASSRFERGADVDAAPVGIARAAALLRADRRGHAASGALIDRYPAPRPPRRFRCARRASRACSAWTCRRTTCRDPRAARVSASSRPTVDASRAGASPCRRFRVDVVARGRPDRGGRPALRLRSAADDASRRWRAPQPPPDPRDRARSHASARCCTAAGSRRR